MIPSLIRHEKRRGRAEFCQGMDQLADQLYNVTLEKSKNLKAEPESKFTFELCCAEYTAEENLKKHMSEAHGLGGGKLLNVMSPVLSLAARNMC